MRNFDNPENRWANDRLEQFGSFIQHVLERIKKEGPLSPEDFAQTGSTGRVMLTDATAIDAGIGDAEGDGFYIYTDYKVDIYSFPDIEYLWLFSGVGFGFHKYKKEFDNPQKDDIDENRTEIRVPFGIAYDFGKLPFGVFFELIPAFQISPDVDFHFRGVLGARYYF
ncbi:MAG: hypothetical protein SVR08_04530 [Spirochaetota bacterium]|nr:hypothetical protein [Spirochaetota bacterium]